MATVDILAKPQAIAPEKLWSFLKKLSLSRPVEPATLADGVLVGEIIHTYVPLLVTAGDLQKFAWEVQVDMTGRGVWTLLSRTALKQLCIQLSEECLSGILSGDKDKIQEFLGVLMQQVEHYERVQRNFGTVARTNFMEHFHSLTTLRTFRGTPFDPPATSLHTKKLIRLSNVDYQTKKIDVQKFLYPIIAHHSEIHIPIHLASGKMTYTIYVEFDDSMLPLKAVDLHSGHTLLSRRVEITVVSIDELYYTLYGRTLSGGPLSASAAMLPMPSTPTTAGMPGTPTPLGSSTPTGNPAGNDYFSAVSAPSGEFLSDDTKEQIAKLCKTVKNSFNGKTPERPFEHVISFLRLLPWKDSLLTMSEIDRGFELLLTAVVTLVQYLQNDSQKCKFPTDLLDRLVTFGKTLPFSTEQHDMLQKLHGDYIRAPTVPIVSPLPHLVSSLPTRTPTPGVSQGAAAAASSPATKTTGGVTPIMPPMGAAGTAATTRRDPLRLDLLSRRLKQNAGAGAPVALSINIPTASVVFPGPASAPLKARSNGTNSAGIIAPGPSTSLPRSGSSLNPSRSYEAMHSAPLYGSFDFMIQKSPFGPLSTGSLDCVAASATDMPNVRYTLGAKDRYPSPAPSFKSGLANNGRAASCLSLASVLSADNIFSPITPITPDVYATPSEEIYDAPESVLGMGLWAAM